MPLEDYLNLALIGTARLARTQPPPTPLREPTEKVAIHEQRRRRQRALLATWWRRP